MSETQLPAEIAAVCKMPVIAKPNLNWKSEDLENVLLQANAEAADRCLREDGWVRLCLSGGLDSSLSLAMIRYVLPKAKICAVTIGGSKDHADVRAAKDVAKQFHVADHRILIPTESELVYLTGEMRCKLMHPPESKGDLGVFALYDFMSSVGFRCVIAHDGIDELMGGYWEHIKDPNMEPAFLHFWQRLAPDHLQPLETKAAYSKIVVIYPYLNPTVVAFVSRIPLADRTNRDNRKAPLRKLACLYGVPEHVVSRPKKGFCGALDKE